MKNLVVIVCRSGLEPLTPGNKVGYECAYCKRPLQVSARALEAAERFKPDSRLLCNPCGIQFSGLADAKGKLDRVFVGPNAKEYMDSARSKDNPFADWVREQMKRNHAREAGTENTDAPDRSK